MIGFVCVSGTDHGTPPPAPAPGALVHGAQPTPPPPDFPPRVSSFNHPTLVALQGQQPQRAATLVVTKDNDEPPTYEVIPYSTGRWHSSRIQRTRFRFEWGGLRIDNARFLFELTAKLCEKGRVL